MAINYYQFFQEKKKNFSKASMKVDVSVHHRLLLPHQNIQLH